VNIKSIIYILGTLLKLLAISMLIPIFIGIKYHEEDAFVFIICMGITYISAWLFQKTSSNKITLQYRDGFVIVTIGWLLVSLYGAFPYLLGNIFNNPVDAFFESVSGFTTTGASVMISLESLSHTMLFWRSLTHWVGGMGIIIMTMAILPQLAGNMSLYQAEATGPLDNRIKPRIQETAKTLWFIYFFLTAGQILLLFINGMPLFEALIHSFGTISTGGFSSRALSVRAYDNIIIEVIIILFMLLGATNFNLIYGVFKGKIRNLFFDEELRLYFIILIICIALISLNLYIHVYNEFSLSLRYAGFQVVSIATTTGFATANYDIWPPFSRWILLILMFIGGSAGSTAGGIKVIRINVLLKKGLQELYILLHPNAVRKIKINKRVITERESTAILGFFFLYIAVFVIATICLTYYGIDIISSISAVAATLGNTGPGLELVGPLKSFLPLPPRAKILLSFCMIIGRLEIYTILVFIFMDWR